MIESRTRPAMLRFGSWWGRLTSDRPEDIESVRLVFGAELYPLDSERCLAFDCRIIAESGDPKPESEVPPAGMLLTQDGPLRTITTEALHVELGIDTFPTPVRIWVRRPEFPVVELHFHFSVVFHKILFLVDRLILHGAAVHWNEAINLFLGEKGAGKSTICLALARAGATVLGEDRLVLRRSPDGFLISGGDERSRVTERTERHFFSEPLAVSPRDFAGTLKKEIRIGDHFRSRPFEDFVPNRLFFPRITGRSRVAPVKSQAALLRLVRSVSLHHRFAGGRDQAEFLDFLHRFVATVPAWDLDLSTDLADLERLGEQLRVV